jgi:hypothetical protein
MMIAKARGGGRLQSLLQVPALHLETSPHGMRDNETTTVTLGLLQVITVYPRVSHASAMVYTHFMYHSLFTQPPHEGQPSRSANAASESIYLYQLYDNLYHVAHGLFS